MLLRKVAITGGAGFIGTHLTRALVARGCEVLVIDDLSRAEAPCLPPGAQLVALDIRHSALGPRLSSFAADAVVHLAAQSEVRVSLRDPILDASINVLGTAHVLHAARQAGAKVVVFASSGGTVYGQADALPTPETAPIAPLSPYGASKAAAEMYVGLAGRQGGMRTVSLRFANVYGPGQSTSGEAGVVALFLRALQAQQPLTIRGDGQQTRDFLWVGDAVEAIVRACERPEASGSLNVATGQATSILALARNIARVTDSPLRLQHTQSAAAEVRHSCLCAQLAAERLGWVPRVSLDQGLQRTVHALKNDSSTPLAAHRYRQTSLPRDQSELRLA